MPGLGLLAKLFGLGRLIPSSWRLWIAGGAVLMAAVLWFGMHERGVGRAAEHKHTEAAIVAENLALQARDQCRAVLDGQNADIAALSQKSAAKLASAEKAVSDARAVAESLRQSSVRLGGYQPRGSDLCERFEDADRVVVEGLR